MSKTLIPVEPSPTTTIAIALLLLAVPATGCIGASEDDAETGEAPARPTDTSSPATAGELLGLTAPRVHDVRWENGSMGPHEVLVGDNLPLGQTRSMDDAVMDLTEAVPADTPVRVQAKITWDGATGAEFDAAVAAPTYYAYDTETELDRTTVDALVARSSDEKVGVIADADRPDAGPETAYTLRVETTAAPGPIPADVPVALDVPAQARAVEVVPADPDAPLSATAWGPDDTIVGYASRAAGDPAVAVPTNVSGEHVLLANASALLRVVDGDGEPVPTSSPVDPLPLRFEEGEPHELPPDGGSETWSFSLDRAPVAVGFRITSGDAGRQPGTLSDGATVTVRSPEGIVDDTEVECPPICKLGGQGRFFWFSLGAFGDPNLAPGTYEITASYDHAANIEVTPRWLSYER